MIVFPDVERETRDYLLEVLRPSWPELDVRLGIPDNIDWQIDKPYLVTIVVTGTGNRSDVVYERVLIGFEVFAPTQSEASRLVREVRSHIGNWSSVSGLVSGQSDNARPARSGSPDVSYPSYWYASNINFKATDY